MNSYTDLLGSPLCLPTVTGKPVNAFRRHLVKDSFTDIPEHVQTSTNTDNRNGNFTRVLRSMGDSCAYLMNNLNMCSRRGKCPTKETRQSTTYMIFIQLQNVSGSKRFAIPVPFNL